MICRWCGRPIKHRPSLGVWLVTDPMINAGDPEFCSAAPATIVKRGGRTTGPVYVHAPLDLTAPDNVRSYLEAP